MEPFLSDERITRETLQWHLLESIFARAVRGEVLLKGGFALRALLGSERDTQDIDLQQDPQRVPLGRLQKLMRGAIRQALGSGLLLDPVITEPKQTSTVARWKINGRTRIGSRIHLTIEVSRRGLPDERHWADVTHGAGTQITSYDRHALAATKVHALLSETRVAPRDLYDLDVLIRMKAVPPPSMIAGLCNEEGRERLYQKLDLITWDLFRAQVLPHLPEQQAAAFTQDDFDALQVRVGLAVDHWLGGRGADRNDNSGGPAP